ncbi:hypothetical protein WOLCODRAFT_140091 [Wolfiporia cocos MD-104 SS10]|uniref:Uncharacterized protein n=1 Tax=Wolfiporia cocos (strain MD-104) TaxID=742152 RepID=A0A2H3J279_WOLCO|nr:hypothetical protein WOLCODRAFT_140091 [Wolfiporia cocos MD-104 SS10]
MVATFILTRAFAISALFVGAFNLAYAAPVAYPANVHLDGRNCRQEGCTFKEPSSAVASSDVPLQTAVARSDPLFDAIRPVASAPDEVQTIADTALQTVTTAADQSNVDVKKREPASHSDDKSKRNHERDVAQAVTYQHGQADTAEPGSKRAPDSDNCRVLGCT